MGIFIAILAVVFVVVSGRNQPKQVIAPPPPPTIAMAVPAAPLAETPAAVPAPSELGDVALPDRAVAPVDDAVKVPVEEIAEIALPDRPIAPVNPDRLAYQHAGYVGESIGDSAVEGSDQCVRIFTADGAMRISCGALRSRNGESHALPDDEVIKDWVHDWTR